MSYLRFGYGTNGFGDHTLADAVAVLADLGYDGIAVTLDARHLDPFADDLPRRLATLRRLLDRTGMAVVVETGGRYLLDPWREHQPTLMSAHGAQRRLDLLRRAVHIGADLGAEAVSFRSGTADPGSDPATNRDRLARGCAAVLRSAAVAGVPVGLEPGPGMFVDTLDSFDELVTRFDLGLGLTLDVGHCRCPGPRPVADCVRRALPRLVHVHIEDVRCGAHEHLEFGAGDLDFPPVLAALEEGGYRGLVSVELPCHSHAAPEVARRSWEFLRLRGGHRDNGRAAWTGDDPVGRRPG
ncbi:sugar phosphate isomerase/epimerase family protein [Saccharothrix sp. BKS2]|uniref:sugar phosphate isomerase/epimerase family protein n=1 Tax=Saccharothrix sp. BKS2 TaxID=3064400 RepID=UPI0039E93377